MLGNSAVAQLALCQFPGGVVSSGGHRVGWLWHDPNDLDRRIKAQRRFGAPEYADFKAQAFAGALAQAANIGNKTKRKAIEKAIFTAQSQPHLARQMEAVIKSYREFELEDDEDEALSALQRALSLN